MERTRAEAYRIMAKLSDLIPSFSNQDIKGFGYRYFHVVEPEFIKYEFPKLKRLSPSKILTKKVEYITGQFAEEYSKEIEEFVRWMEWADTHQEEL